MQQKHTRPTCRRYARGVGQPRCQAATASRASAELRRSIGREDSQGLARLKAWAVVAVVIRPWPKQNVPGHTPFEVAPTPRADIPASKVETALCGGVRHSDSIPAVLESCDGRAERGLETNQLRADEGSER